VKEKRVYFKDVFFQGWELEFLVRAAQMKHSYECAEYSPDEEKDILQLIEKLKNNATVLARIEQEANRV
jgi:hypothetical protein